MQTTPDYQKGLKVQSISDFVIILINGSINSGKSTVAKLIANKLKQSALIEIDSFHEMIEWMPIDKAIPLNLKNAVSVIKNFSENKINSIVPYPLSEKNYKYLIDSLKSTGERIELFTLAPRLEQVLKNRGKREITEWEKERIKHHYKIGIPKLSFGDIIDNTNQTPEETAEKILKSL